jgi:broad specificity phosphatase PhoE
VVKGSAQILLVRHPETEANINGRFVGRGDSPYTHEGRLQLARVPHKIARFTPDVVWSSPLPRALRLAQRAARAADTPLRVDDRLLELDFGRAEGMTIEEVQAAGLAFEYRNAQAPVAPEGESRAQIEARAAAFMDELVGAGGRHAVVTHGGAFRASLVYLLGLASTDIWAFHIHNAQLAQLRVVEGHGMLEEYVQG